MESQRPQDSGAAEEEPGLSEGQNQNQQRVWVQKNPDRGSAHGDL